MADRRPFDPQNPYDALADLARVQIAYYGSEVMSAPQYVRMAADPNGQFEALLIGLLTGVAGIAMSNIRPEAHAEVRSALLALIPDAVDNARDIFELPPLETIQ